VPNGSGATATIQKHYRITVLAVDIIAESRETRPIYNMLYSCRCNRTNTR